MAFAKKCDVCGAFYEEYNIKSDPKNTNGIMFVNVDYARQYYSHEPIDCCPTCMESIKKYIDRKRGDVL